MNDLSLSTNLTNAHTHFPTPSTIPNTYEIKQLLKPSTNTHIMPCYMQDKSYSTYTSDWSSMCIGLDSGAKLQPNGVGLTTRPHPHHRHITPRPDGDLKIASPTQPNPHVMIETRR